MTKGFHGRNCPTDHFDEDDRLVQVSNGVSVTDSDEDVVARFEYSAWGELLPGSFDSVGLALRFIGGYGVRTDLETGLMYMRHRWYCATLQRFISRDPIGLRGGSNTFTYVGNNPVNFVDPEGLQPNYRVTVSAYTGVPGHAWMEVRDSNGNSGFNAGAFPGGTVYEDYERINGRDVFTDRGGPRGFSLNADHKPEDSWTFEITPEEYKKLSKWAPEPYPWNATSNCATYVEDGLEVIGKKLPRNFRLLPTALPSDIIKGIRHQKNPPKPDPRREMVSRGLFGQDAVSPTGIKVPSPLKYLRR